MPLSSANEGLLNATEYVVKFIHDEAAFDEGWKPMADCKEYRGPFLMSGDLPMAIIHPCLTLRLCQAQ